MTDADSVGERNGVHQAMMMVLDFDEARRVEVPLEQIAALCLAGPPAPLFVLTRVQEAPLIFDEAAAVGDVMRLQHARFECAAG